jgi:hypothetical protein
VSSELERLLRDAREALPAPDEDAALRVRRRVLTVLRRGRARTRALALAGATLVAAVALGVTAGSLNAPSGVAAREPASLGFVPEPGWFALQSPPPAVRGEQTVAVAANVPFAHDDTVHGFVEPSGLPYSTLLTLPPRGIVLVATMALPSVPIAMIPDYHETKLPLRVRDGVPYLQWGAQVRHDQALGQYQLRASIRGYNVDVVAYFGTPQPEEALLDEAQRQLDELVVRPGAPLEPAAAPRSALPPSTKVAVIDHTYACATVFLGGVYRVQSRAHAGRRSGSHWARLPYAVVASGGVARTPGVDAAPGNSLAWVSAGAPTPGATVDLEWLAFTAHGGGTLGVNRSLCNSTRASVSLSATGLRGGAVGSDGASFQCDSPKKVFVRFRATVRGSTALRERARLFLATNASASEAKLAVRTRSGRLLAYADVADSGKARLFTARSCVPD